MRTVDFYFDFSSTNSCFAAFLLPDLCRRTGARINWLPLHAAALFRTTGFNVMAMAPPKRYLWRDHQRWAARTGSPFRRPSRFPIKTAMALRCVMAFSHIAKSNYPEAVEHYTKAVFKAYWEDDRDISRQEVLEEVGGAAKVDFGQMLRDSDSVTFRDELAAIVARAISRGVFGAPTFFVDDEMFWGKDRLDFIERLLTS